MGSTLAKRRILLALGLPAGDQTAITASIRRLEEQEWRRWLPPVVTAWEGEQPKLVLALPVERVAYPLTLEIIQESGAQSEFTVHPAETPIHDRKSLAEGEVVRYLVLLPQTLPNGYHVVRPAESRIRRRDSSSLLDVVISPRRWRRTRAGVFPPSSTRSSARITGASATSRICANWSMSPLISGVRNRYQSTACPLPRSSRGGESLLAEFPAVPEPSLHRCRSDPGVRQICRGPRRARCYGYEIAACRALKVIAYRRVKAIKMKVLEQVYACFRRKHDAVAAGGGRVESFERFRREQGEPLHRYALFETLSETFSGTPWQQWPEPYRRPDSSEAAEFAEKHIERIGFFEFLQWQADEQLGRAQVRAGERGMPVGIYRDLAVGVAPKGSMRGPTSRWSCKKPRSAARRTPSICLARTGASPTASVGASRTWLRSIHCYATRQHAPCRWPAHRSRDGVNAPVLDSGRKQSRHRCIRELPVRGANGDSRVRESAQPLPDRRRGFRNRPGRLSRAYGGRERAFYRVLYFEKDGDRFKRPEEYPGLALACVTTHDLAALQGFWRGADLELKRRLKLYPSEKPNTMTKALVAGTRRCCCARCTGRVCCRKA